MILRELLIKLGLNVDEASFAKGELAAKAIEVGLEKLVEWGKEAVHAFAENIEKSIEYGDKILKTSQSIGIATDALQQLQYAGRLADLSAEEMSQSIGLLSRKMEEAKNKGGEASKAFKGIAFLDHGKLKPTEAVLGEIADKFKSMPDGAEKTALAMQLFGRAGKQMIPLLNKGSEELDAMKQEAKDLGLVMDKESVEASEKLADNFKRLKAITEGLWRGAIAPLLPAINKLVERFLAWRKANAEIMRQKLQSVIQGIIKTVEVLGETFDFLIKNMFMVKVIIVSLTAALLIMNAASVAAAAASAAAWAVALAPFAAIAAAIAGIMLIYDDLRVYNSGKGKSVFGYIVKSLDDWAKPKATDPYFVVWIKDFIRLLVEAMRLVREFDAMTGAKNYAPKNMDKMAAQSKGAIQLNADRQTLNSAQTRVGQGLPLTAEENAALARSNISPAAFRANHAPEYRGPMSRAGAGGGGAPVVNIGNINQQAGQSGEDLAQQIAEQVGIAWDSRMQEAAAGVAP